MKVGTKLAAMSCATALIFLIIGGASYFSFSQLIETNKWLLHSEKVLVELSTLQAHLGDAESNERAYLITGRPEMLQSYEAHRDEIPKLLDRLQSMLGDNSHQLQRLHSMRPIIKARLRFMDDTIATYKQEGALKSMDIVRSGKGIELQSLAMDRIEELIGDEVELRKQRNLSVERSIGNSRLTVILGIVLGIVFVSFCSFIISQDIATSINLLISSAENMDRGRFDSMTAVDNHDEFGALAATFSNLGQRLQKLNEDAAGRQEQLQHLTRLIDDAGHELNGLSLRAEELLSSVKQKLIESHDQPKQLSDLLSLVQQGCERTSNLQKMAESVSATVFKSKQTCDASLGKLHELLSNAEELSDRIKQNTLNAASFSESNDNLFELTALLESLNSELSLFALATAVESGDESNARHKLEVIAGKLNKLIETHKHDSIKIKQLLSKIQLSAQKSLLSSQDTTTAIAGIPRLTEQLAKSLNQIAQSTCDAQTAAEPLAAAAAHHALDMTELPHSLTKMLSDMERQIAGVKQAELMLAELRESIKSTGALLKTSRLLQESPT